MNGKIIAEQTIAEGSIAATFSIPYTAGKLTAHCFKGDKEVASETITTAGKPVAIHLKADRQLINASKNDLAYINVEIVNVVPNISDMLFKFQIIGNGSIAGVGNGNPRDMSSFQKPEKKVFQGKGLVIIQPTDKTGVITIRATSEGLKCGVIKIKTH
ncbi:MAG: hypothetical protein H7Y04_09440 [Verrucomicrobia bacterium]|nr:hypothetical protein [Cytophagales bacterium]